MTKRDRERIDQLERRVDKLTELLSTYLEAHKLMGKHIDTILDQMQKMNSQSEKMLDIIKNHQHVTDEFLPWQDPKALSRNRQRSDQRESDKSFHYTDPTTNG